MKSTSLSHYLTGLRGHKIIVHHCLDEHYIDILIIAVSHKPNYFFFLSEHLWLTMRTGLTVSCLFMSPCFIMQFPCFISSCCHIHEMWQSTVKTHTNSFLNTRLFRASSSAAHVHSTLRNIRIYFPNTCMSYSRGIKISLRALNTVTCAAQRFSVDSHIWGIYCIFSSSQPFTRHQGIHLNLYSIWSGVYCIVIYASIPIDLEPRLKSAFSLGRIM